MATKSTLDRSPLLATAEAATKVAQAISGLLFATYQTYANFGVGMRCINDDSSSDLVASEDKHPKKKRTNAKKGMAEYEDRCEQLRFGFFQLKSLSQGGYQKTDFPSVTPSSCLSLQPNTHLKSPISFLPSSNPRGHRSLRLGYQRFPIRRCHWSTP